MLRARVMVSSSGLEFKYFFGNVLPNISMVILGLEQACGYLDNYLHRQFHLR